MSLNIFKLLCIITAVTGYSLVIFLFKYWKTNSLARILSGVAVMSGSWGVIGSIFSSIPKESYDLALFWWQIGYITPILGEVFYVHFVFKYLRLKKNYLLTSIYLLGFIFIFFDFYKHSQLFLGDLKWVFGQFYCLDWIARKNVIWLVYYITFLIILSYAFFLLIKAYRNSKGVQKNQLKYFILGSIIGWLGVELQFLLAFRIYIYPFSVIFMGIYPLIFTYAILKYRLMDIRVAITRVGIFLALYTAVLGLPFYLGYQTNSWVLSTSFAATFATIGPLIYRTIQKKAEDLLLAQQRHYQHILLQAAGGMIREHNLNRLLKLIVRIVKKTVKISFAIIFSYDKENKIYKPMSARGYKITSLDLNFPEDAPIITYMKNNPNPFIPEELPSDLRKCLEEKLKTSFELFIPSVVEKRVQGFLILGEKLDRSPYSQDDISVFSILSRQAALAIENCLFFEEFKKVQQQLFQAEKLASIGGIADGVAHQIKNRLNHFSLATGELRLAIQEFVKSNYNLANNRSIKEFLEYLLKITDSLISNVKRTDSVVRGILQFARTQDKELFFGYFSLEEIINPALELISIKHEVSEIPLEKDLEIDLIWGIKSQLGEVIYNLLDNAYEATQELALQLFQEEKKEYHPKIKIKAYQELTHYFIIISDNGIGIKEEDKKKIFSPFFTTKSSYKSGSGIGMYVVRRIIEENHNGKIWFESTYMKGTKFYIQLPKPLSPKPSK